MADRTAASVSIDPAPSPAPSTTSSVVVVEGTPTGNEASVDGAPASRSRVLAVPAGPSVFRCDGGDGEPALVALDAIPVSSSATGGNSRDLFADEALVLFEPARTDGGEKLLMITPPGSAVRLNGLAPPLVVPLAVGDQVDLGASGVLHVSRYRRSAPIAAPPELVGRRCSLCLGEFTEESRLVRCDGCDSARHLEDAASDVPEADRLECAALGPCPDCGTEPSDADGLAFWPEGVAR